MINTLTIQEPSLHTFQIKVKEARVNGYKFDGEMQIRIDGKTVLFIQKMIAYAIK